MTVLPVAHGDWPQKDSRDGPRPPITAGANFRQEIRAGFTRLEAEDRRERRVGRPRDRRVGHLNNAMTSAVIIAPALNRFLEESQVLSRLSIMAALNEEMRRSEATFESVLKSIERDPRLADAVFHCACSAYFGGRTHQCTLAEAFARMGVTEFHRTVAIAHFHTHMSTRPVPEFVAHADHVARLCELIAGHCAPDISLEAFFAGLCHDVAVPAMVESVTDFEYFAIQALGHDPEMPDLERECNQFTHCEAGAEIALAMGFSEAVGTAVRLHHEPGRLLELDGDAARLLAMIVLAERVIAVAQDQLAAVFVDADEHDIREACWLTLGLDQAGFDALVGQMLEVCRLWKRAG